MLDIKDEDLLSQVSSAISNIAAISLEAHYPTLASIPHSIINGYKNVLAVAVETEYSFDLADKVTTLGVHLVKISILLFETAGPLLLVDMHLGVDNILLI